MKKTVIELFAGVGGFRIGLNKIRRIDKKGEAVEKGEFKFVWANQWEPSTKIQHAFDCYNQRFAGSKDHNSNVDITLVDKSSIPDHTLLCGGFPCQDYSVAHSLSKEKGIEGKKGVLWWQIRDILIAKKPSFVFLENVDRLIKSPAKQRGRDFGIMLRCFADLGYSVEWRVINAAEYGMPQRRRRIYILAHKNETSFFNKLSSFSAQDVFLHHGLFARSFPVITENLKISTKDILKYDDVVDVSDSFAFSFNNSGYMKDGIIYTCKTNPKTIPALTLGEIIEHNVDEHYFLTASEEQKFKYLRGSKKIPRVAPNGETYMYSEGAMSPVDYLNLPGRTMLTSEGSINRSTHIVEDSDNHKLRRLTPIECERMNQFPDNWTNSGMPEKRRYFMMGNALVCGIIEKIGEVLSDIIDNEE